MNIITKRFDLGDGRMIEIETGKLAKQADGSAVVRMNNTMLLATVCSKKEVGENVDFMPLTVDYQEKYAAMGRFPGGFFKREARPSEHEILIARLVDRALRPLFPDNFHAEVQVLDKSTIALDVGGLQIVKLATTFANQTNQCTLAHLVLFVFLHQLGEMLDSISEESYLSLDRTSVFRVFAILGKDFLFFLFCQIHNRL